MDDPEILRWNDRMKAVSTLFYQLGGALLAAAIVQVYYRFALSWDAVIWSLIGTALIWLGWQVLGLLQTEN